MGERVEQNRRLWVVENRCRSVVTAARDAGQARLAAARLLHGREDAPERDALVVREPEEEERAAFEAAGQPAMGAVLL